MSTADLFRRRYACLLACPAYAALRGRPGSAWIRKASAEDRKIFSELGRMKLRSKDVNWHAQGGKARAATAARNKRGRFTKKGDAA